MCATHRVVRILSSKLSDSLCNSDMENSCSLHNISCIFSSPLKGCHELRVRKEKGDEVEHVHGSVDLDLMKSAGAAN